KVLNILKQNANTYVSGQEIADTLFLTRAGIWKAIKNLRESGYKIESVTNKGYRLVCNYDGINIGFIQKSLPETPSLKYYSYEEVTSTNDVAREHADKESDLLVIANSQSNGRGRKGRSFFSPKDTGLYFSLLIHPELPFSKATYLTCIAAESMVLSIHDTLGIEVSIKWVNDIFYGDKKIAGILTETFGSLEEEFPEYIVVGVGINIYPFSEELPSDIKKRAGFLVKNGADSENLKNLLCINFIKHFYRFLSEIDRKTFLDGYIRHSNLIGKYVQIKSDKNPSKKEYALVTGIDDECRLLVSYDDKKSAALAGKEVSVVKY
ncbi:MAG: biotin--[Lachnospiraceae bacterium]|nr:biotin--[acetyl-CoA-carboxylase] ligase [Lachnospiraceae bacterium]